MGDSRNIDGQGNIRLLNLPIKKQRRIFNFGSNKNSTADLFLYASKAGFPEINYMPLTFTTEMGIRTARLMNVENFIPTHFEGWKHFDEQPEYLYDQITHSDIKERLLWLRPGLPTVIEI